MKDTVMSLNLNENGDVRVSCEYEIPDSQIKQAAISKNIAAMVSFAFNKEMFPYIQLALKDKSDVMSPIILKYINGIMNTEEDRDAPIITPENAFSVRSNQS